MIKRYLKYISVITLFFFSLYLVIPVFPGRMLISRAEASSIEEKDVYRGIGIALLLILISRIGQSADNDQDRDNFDIPNLPDIDTDDPEVEILARAIYGEARGEPYQGQVAVAAVIMNRVKSPDFPNTIKEIVYQSGQFSSVDDGQINLNPNAAAYRAAYDALNGDDPSYGALYFYNPETAKTLWWLESRTVTVRIGNHVFAK